MAKVFGILTAIVLALAAFVANKNKTAYENEISATNAQKAILKKSQTRLAADEVILKALPIKRAEVDAEVVKLTDTEAEDKAANAKLAESIADKTTKQAANKQKLDDIREKTSKIGNINELAAKMNATNAEIEQLSQSVTAAESKLANLTALNTTTEAHNKATQDKFKKYSSGESLSSLKTKISMIYPSWGFVTLAAGNNAGVVAGSSLNVVRDGQTIAKLVVTSVERSTASAGVVPGSIAPNVTLMVGDIVVPGDKSTKVPVTATANK
jgi:hypothetical protein